MNELGAITLLLSGSTVIFSIITALLGLSLRQERGLFRVLTLELLDASAGRRGRASLASRFARSTLGIWRPFKRSLLRGTGMRTQAMALELSGQALVINAALSGLALFVLMLLMVTSDLTNRYVVMNSAVDLPFFFRITGTWAGSSGSLLFWYFMLTFFSAVAVVQARERLPGRLPFLYLIVGTLQALFVMLNLFFDDAQPFRVYPLEMESGTGINPLLLHWAMIIHPPVLYVGYVSFAIPFAITMAAVISGKMREDWLPFLRRWSLFSWFFLGTGILLGSKWAYEELGWGGYWAWDPVENASLMPFLLATAFLHSLIVQERRGMLRFWNVLLITLSYHFCLLGTWITRSGILQGPHTFAESTIGTPFIIYIAISFTFFTRYLYFARNKLKPARELEAVTSKEGSMLLNNFLMALATLIVLIGVFSPLLPLDCVWENGFACHAVEWKQSTYNKIMVPIGILTLFLMGASPLLAWRKGADTVYRRTLRTPLLIGLVGTILFALLYGFFFSGERDASDGPWGPGVISEIFSILTVGVACFTLAGLFEEYRQGIRSRRNRFGENSVQAFIRLVLRNKRRYGGYLVHISIVFLFVGYAGSAFKKTTKFDFHYYKMRTEPGSEFIHYYSGDRAFFDNYEIEARDLFFKPEFQPNADRSNPVHFTVAQQAHFHVQPGGRSVDGFKRTTEVKPKDQSVLAFANRPAPALDQFSKFWTGFTRDGRMITERHFHPRIDPASGRVQRDRRGEAQRTPTSKPDIRSTWNEDIYIQLGSMYEPGSRVNAPFNHHYEFYYHQTDRSLQANARLFPSTLVATLEVWINPLVKFIWLGSILFFLSGLVILMPFGERNLDR